MNLDDITPLVLTYNEEANIRRTLEGLRWARRIVVVDSGSSDGTLAILSAWPGVEIEHRAFDDFASQCSYGLSLIRTPWVLSIDADYQCPPEIVAELASLSDVASGYEYGFKYCIYGRQLRASLYPPRVILFRVVLGSYATDGHAHRLQLRGRVDRGKTAILHDDRKPLARWLESQAKYADLEVEKLLALSKSQLGWKDRLRKKIVWAPPLTLFYCLFRKGLILDGWPGVYYTLQRVYAELLLSLKLLDRRLKSQGSRATGRELEARNEQSEDSRD